MAEQRDELNMRRQRREEQRNKQRAEQRRIRRALIIALVILALCGGGIFLIARNSQSLGVQVQQTTAAGAAVTTPITEPPTETTRPQRNTQTVIHVKAAGDLNVTDSVVMSGLAATGYDFTRAFMDVAPILADGDLTLMNFEGNVCGEPYGTERTSAPAEMLTALRNAGVDVLQMANSCAINNGLIGMTSTLRAIESAGLSPVGAYATEAEWRKSGGYTIVEIEGVKIAIVAFTKGVGGMGMPAGNENLVNLLYTDYYSTYQKLDKDRINKTMDRVNAERPDIVIAMLHWGSEYNDVISSSQESIVSLLQKNGVDVILGTHPHMVQKVDFDPITGQLVAYSLGDFYGDATRGGTSYSIILDLEITKDLDTGATRVTGWDYTPIYTLTPDDCDGFQRVVRIEETMVAHQMNYVDKITAECYADMQYSLGRITARLAGEGQTVKEE